MWPSEYGLRRHNKRRTNEITKPSSYSTVTMVIYLIYLISKWISTYSELLPSIGILPIVVSLLGR
ncbi:hypothetical protein Goklo_029071 [Gossypium klotzschianum]|uniref:Uncharacterized protein n=2 Tax=Gossypium klotzschianum TaxID=34286 RepID=A0A7J8W6Q9_9ROSI|nr:hypothetical protein [Gossypium klotzschianum]